jgi:hypothetical protein
MILSKIKIWLAAAGAVLLALLTLRMKMLKASLEKAREDNKILEASRNAHRKKEEVIKEEEANRVSRKAELIKELEKEGEDFEGLNNLNNPNDF